MSVITKCTKWLVWLIDERRNYREKYIYRYLR
jgi:hypothetical protein